MTVVSTLNIADYLKYAKPLGACSLNLCLCFLESPR